LLLPSTRRKRPHWACRIFLNPRTGPEHDAISGRTGKQSASPSHSGAVHTRPPSGLAATCRASAPTGTAACLRSGTAPSPPALVTSLGATRFCYTLCSEPLRAASYRPARRLLCLFVCSASFLLFISQVWTAPRMLSLSLLKAFYLRVCRTNPESRRLV